MTPSRFIDIGVNLTDKRFSDDVAAVTRRAREAGVLAMVITGTSVAESRAALNTARQDGAFVCTAGIHPHSARTASDAALAEIRDLLTDEQVRAVGETGLDFNRDFSPRPDQERSFEAHLALAAELGKPVFLHQRDAHDRFLPMLREYRDHLAGAVLHCFTGTRRELFDYLDLDCHIGITGWICDDRRGTELQSLVHNIPADKLMLETDSPWLLPRDLPGKNRYKGRNEPALLPWIAEAVAHCRKEDPATLAEQVWQTSMAFFDLEEAQLTS